MTIENQRPSPEERSVPTLHPITEDDNGQSEITAIADPVAAVADPVADPVAAVAAPVAAVSVSDSAETRFLKWVFVGKAGIRAGWSVAIFLALTMLFAVVFGLTARLITHRLLHIHLGDFTAPSNILGESVQFLSLLAAAAVTARIEKRRIVDYNLSGPHRLRLFLLGILAGFVFLSILAGALFAGGWIHFASASLSGTAILEFGILWGIAFLLTGFSEEGLTRCYMLFTLTRGINYWWALGTVAAFSLFAAVNPHSNGAGGVYLMAGLGVLPCLLLHRNGSQFASFWEASWLTSTFFGYVHTFNDGETWIGIFSAASIGFLFCVSIRLTGSAWWAIGYHAAWDWAQTFFYGTPDSGFASKGHFLTTNPTGPKLWSGGSDGPEGSLLVLGIILLTLLFLIVVYGRRRRLTLESTSAPAQPRLF